MSARKPTVGILAVSPAESLEALAEALEARGWKAGRDYRVLMPAPSSVDSALEANVRALIEARVDVIVAQTKPAARVAVEATREVPVVLGAFNGDPAAEGIVESLDRPGGNVTGTYYLGHAGVAQRFELLKALVPRLTHVGVLMNRRSAFSLELAEQACGIANGADLEASIVGADDDVDRAMAEAVSAGMQAFATVTGADMYALRREIARASWRQRAPTVMGSIGFAELGGLAKLGPDIPVLWRKMAGAHVIPILEGTPPGELPMVGLDAFELVINLTTAERMAIVVPDVLKARAAKLVFDMPAFAKAGA